MPSGLPVVTLYRTRECGLCDQAEEILRKLSFRLRFRVETVDVEADEALHQKYLLEVPVVAVGGREVARAPIYSGPLEEAIAGALPTR